MSDHQNVLVLGMALSIKICGGRKRKGGRYQYTIRLYLLIFCISNGCFTILLMRTYISFYSARLVCCVFGLLVVLGTLMDIYVQLSTPARTPCPDGKDSSGGYKGKVNGTILAI